MTRRSVIDKAVVLPTVMLALLLIFPTTMGKLKFLPIYKAISIKQNKKLPPHIAFLESNFDPSKSEGQDLETRFGPPTKIGADLAAPVGPYILTQKRILAGITIRKDTEILLPSSEAFYKARALKADEAQGPQWLKNVVRKPASIGTGDSKILSLASGKRVSGAIEITGGLAVTNNNHIEVRRANDGVFQEMGKVDLEKGLYSIDVEDPSGTIVARLVDQAGAVLGEGSIRLSQFSSTGGNASVGPRLELAPSVTWGGTVSRYYPPAKGRALETPVVTTYGGENKVNVAKSGELSFDGMVKNSSTVVRAETKGHRPSNRIMIAGEQNFELPLLPESMIDAMNNIVSDSATATLPQDSEKVAMVWGTVRIDGKPISGISVQSESDPDAKVIYFNELMIPDAKLKATSSNGMYAFNDIRPGFHALLAQRGDAYFGHQNILAELGTVSIGDLSSTLRTEPVTVKAFDAFTGEPASLVAHLQSLQEPVSLTQGSATVILTQVPRLSLIYIESSEPFLKANYFYNDTDPYVHLPMIREDWLLSIRSEEKVNQTSSTGTIVGFVTDEAFEVYLAGAAKNSAPAIIYFDAAGRRMSKGIAGGGFVIFNVPPGLQEVVVVSNKSDKILSKIVPVDEKSTSVLSFNSY